MGVMPLAETTTAMAVVGLTNCWVLRAWSERAIVFVFAVGIFLYP